MTEAADETQMTHYGEEKLPPPVPGEEPKGEAPEASEEASPKTEYIILRVEEDQTLVPVNERDEHGRLIPVAGYSNKQAVRTLLITREGSEGRFVAVPVRSFVVIERKVETVTTDTLEIGEF